MVEVVDDGAHDLFEEFEVEQERGFVECAALQRDEPLIVVAVGVLALAGIVAEVVAGGEAGFYGYFKNDSGIPSVAASVIWMGAEGTRLQLVPYFDCTVLCGFLAFPPGAAGFFGTTLGLLE